MTFDIVSFLMGNMTGGGDVFATVAVNCIEGAVITATNGKVNIEVVDTKGFSLLAIPTPDSVPENWTISATKDGKTFSKVISISTYGERYEVLLTGIDELREKTAQTNYCRLSEHIGDGASFNGRWFTRTTDEPVLFCGAVGGDSYNSYCVISCSSTAPEYTYNKWGDLYWSNTLTLQNGRVFYCYFMNGMWTYNIASIRWTVDNKTEQLSNTTYVGSSGNLTTTAMSVIGTDASEFEEILNEYYDCVVF